ncbi:MAG: ATP-dependent helicase [Thermoplasmata archaeon HGW-Thermoplasmata-1]|nr:MAG: ATP-dependent helicase [Thermoplasmata archaeon HGW-Thermoplasmata-1]
MIKFEELGICEPVLRAIEDAGFEEPSEIQEKAIPHVVAGCDIIAESATGSGKTLAFGAGLIQNAVQGGGIQGLVVTPTRELAEQVKDALAKFSRHKKLKVAAVYGGVAMNLQIEQLKSAELVVGTPGRLIDHLNHGTMNLGGINTLVLDEADLMLDMGFISDVEWLINACPKERQTMLFSATLSGDVKYLARTYLNDPVEASAESYVDPSKLVQLYYDVPNDLKFSLLAHLLKGERAGLVMVFCNTRRYVDFVTKNLKQLDIDAHAIHGGLTQMSRNSIMKQFHSKKAQVLVCTDVAARGLDIKGVSHVYNYDLPTEPKQYVHRVGRTARAGNEGKAVTILSSRDYDMFSRVVAENDFHIAKMELPKIRRVSINWGGRDGNRDGGARGGGFRVGGRDGNRDGRSRDSRYSSGGNREPGRSHGRSEQTSRVGSHGKVEIGQSPEKRREESFAVDRWERGY